MTRNGLIRRAAFFLCGWMVAIAAGAQYTVTGGAKGSPLLAEDNSQNDVQVYLVYGMEQVTAGFTASVAGTHKWYRYTQSKLDAVEIPCTQQGNTSTVTGLQSGFGYFAEVAGGGLPKYIWLIDYSAYAVAFSSLAVRAEGDPCSGVQFEGRGTLPTMYYYLPNNGFRTVLQRTFTLSYDTRGEWSDESRAFPAERRTESKKIIATDTEGTLFRFSASEPPYADTDFTLSGDAFATHFGVEKSITTAPYEAVAVQLHVDTVLTVVEAENMNNGKEGYNAPATLLFTAHANDPVAARYLWRIYRVKDLVDAGGGEEGGEDSGGSDSGTQAQTKTGKAVTDDTTGEEGTETGTLLVNFSGEEVEYTFREQGIYRAVAEVSDRSGACVATEELEITIANSFLDIPNVFSPGMTPGMNDEFRVAYKSLVSFKAWIYNRWGKELYHWSDPSQGWDGRVRGKLVAPGTYYYVIEAVGSDGKRYKRAGDVNILRSKREQTEVVDPGTGE